MSITQERKQDLISEYATRSGDTSITYLRNPRNVLAPPDPASMAVVTPAGNPTASGSTEIGYA